MAKAIKKRVFKSGALQYTYDRYVGKDPERIQQYEEELINAEIAKKRDAKAAKLTDQSPSRPNLLG